MKRSNRRGRIGFIAWLLGAGITGGSLLAFFSVTTHHRMLGPWPLGIGTSEMVAYSAWFDVRSAETGHAEAEVISIDGSSTEVDCWMNVTGPAWSMHLLEADDLVDSVRVRRLRTVENGFLVKLPKGSLLRSQRELVLTPASVESMRNKYLEILATELGLVTPEVSFVRLTACGRDMGMYQKEERIGDEFLEKRRLGDAALYSQGFDPLRPDHLFPEFEKDSLAGPVLRSALINAYAAMASGVTDDLPYLIDEEAAIAYLLMAWLEGGNDPLCGSSIFAYSWSHGRIVPIYRNDRGRGALGSYESGTWATNIFVGLLQRPSFRAALKARREKLLEERWRIEERFEAMDRAWLPILAQNGSLTMARARTEAIRSELLGVRADLSDPLEFLDRPMVNGPGFASFTVGQPVDARYHPSVDDERLLHALARKYKAQVSGDSIVFPRGLYAIDEDLVIPFGRSVVLLPGARFEIAAGRSVLCNGALHIRGTRINPVFIRPQDDRQPFGTFAVTGDGSIRCHISGLQVSGGREARINGVHHSGMVSIHGASATVIENSVFENAHGEDALNIRNGRVDLHGCRFHDADMDLVDLDFVQGEVRDCVFLNELKTSQGDGLDLSGSTVLVRDCRIEGMNEKGISAGEASQVFVASSRMERNATALASKDLTIVYVQDNEFFENGTVFSVFRKNAIYGGARVVLYANVFNGNEKERMVDAHSAVLQEERPDERVKALFISD